MYGAFGGYTRWAVVFLIIFVLFFLLVPGYLGGAGVSGPGVAVATYSHHHMHGMHGGYNMMGGNNGGYGGTYGYESPSS